MATADPEGKKRREDSEAEHSSLDAASEQARADLENLQEGRKLSILGAELPIRALVAMGVFLLVFMIAWMALWAALGGLGLGLGWILAAVAGAGAVKLYADRA